MFRNIKTSDATTTAPSPRNVFSTRADLLVARNEWCENKEMAISLYGDISAWDVSSITDFSYMFCSADTTTDCNPACKDFNDDIRDWDVSQGIYFDLMFSGAEMFNQNIGSWNTQNAQSFSQMFHLATSFEQDVSDWNLDNMESMYDCFTGSSIDFKPKYQFHRPYVHRSLFELDTGFTLSPTTNVFIDWFFKDFSHVNRFFKLHDKFRVSTLGMDKVYTIVYIDETRMMFEPPLGVDLPRNNKPCLLKVDHSQYPSFDPQLFSELKLATHAWCANELSASINYGPIERWNIRDITSLDRLFCNELSQPEVIGVYDGRGGYNTGNVLTTIYVNHFRNGDGFTDGIYIDALTSVVAGDQLQFEGFTTIYTVEWVGFSDPVNGEIGLNTVIADPLTAGTKLYKLSFCSIHCGSFNKNIAYWDTRSVTLMRGMFVNLHEFNQPIGEWDTKRVTNMERMFDRAKSFNQPLTNWDVSSVQNLNEMFKNASMFDQDLSSWIVKAAEVDFTTMFSGSAMQGKVEYQPTYYYTPPAHPPPLPSSPSPPLPPPLPPYQPNIPQCFVDFLEFNNTKYVASLDNNVQAELMAAFFYSKKLSAADMACKMIQVPHLRCLDIASFSTLHSAIQARKPTFGQFCNVNGKFHTIGDGVVNAHDLLLFMYIQFGKSVFNGLSPQTVTTTQRVTDWKLRCDVGVDQPYECENLQHNRLLSEINRQDQHVVTKQDTNKLHMKFLTHVYSLHLKFTNVNVHDVSHSTTAGVESEIVIQHANGRNAIITNGNELHLYQLQPTPLEITVQGKGKVCILKGSSIADDHIHNGFMYKQDSC